MSSTWDELAFYGTLASTLFQPKYDLPKVPGPPGHSALGNITAVMRPDYHVQMLDWANQYGGIFKFSLGFQWVVVVSDPAVAVQVLGRGPNSIPRKCVGYKFFDLATNASGAHSFFTTSDEGQWMAIRKAAASAFSSANVKKAFPIALRHALLVADSLDPPNADPANPYTRLLHAHSLQPPAAPASPSSTSPTSPTSSAAASLPAKGVNGSTGGTAHVEAAAVGVPVAANGKASSSAKQVQKPAGKPSPSSTSSSTNTASTAGAGRLGWLASRLGFGSRVADSGAATGPAAASSSSSALLPEPCTCGNCDGKRPASAAPAAAAPAGPVDELDGGCLLRPGGDVGSTTSATSTSASPAAAAAAGVVVDIQEALELSLLHVFIEALFDVRPDEFPGPQVAEDMNLVLEEANERLKVPLRKLAMGLVAPRAQARIRAAQRRLAAVYGSLYDTIRARGPQPDSVTDLWACLGRVRHPKTGELLTKPKLVPEIGALVMAGFDTSSHSVAWALFCLASHPQAQEEARRELASRGLAKEPGSPAPPRPPTLDDLPQLPFLSACVDEAMRMFPVGGTASVREVTTPTRVGDYVIPPGVIVWPMLYALHNSVHNWQAPDQFQPERWLDPGAESGSGSGSGSGTAGEGMDGGSGSGSEGGQPPSQPATPRSPARRAAGGGRAGGEREGGKRFMPFSDGMKSCLGQALGLMEVRTMLAVLLSRYRFALDPSLGGPEAVRGSMIMSLTLKIKGGLRLVATPL
ncbi:hypothetical protein HYH03_004213 [Edaphochlamys debaryana]|uniref:Cytochrome P450 n=1 Tax=Edaphochlamys debaryana TaxID=47281 RepID=A0A836C2F1_9CHLO|nr:hypothetical protein HYH03_004213 [Edaphochlamys debaryana]|eukprot:KAG2497951.1 hypothetical protein HYH03_004213 [Edaphochlamys debaryana]